MSTYNTSNRELQGGADWIVGSKLKVLDSAVVGFGTGTAAETMTSYDMALTWDGTNFIVTPLTDDTLIEIGDSAATQVSWDVKWYANEASGASYLYLDASANLIYTVGVDLQFRDDDFLVFGTGSGASGDVQLEWDTTGTDALRLSATADNTLFEIGIAAATQLSFDVQWYANEANGASGLTMDASENLIYTTGVDLQIKDDDFIVFGTGSGGTGDVQIEWDTTLNPDQLLITPSTDDYIISFGTANATQKSFDVKIFADDSASYTVFDAGSNLFYTTGVDIQVKDGDWLAFGNGAGVAGDGKVGYNTTSTAIEWAAAADGQVMTFGISAATQLSFDLKWYANEANGASYLYLDEGSNLVYTTGVDIQIKDNDVLAIGTGAGAAGDVSITWDTTNLVIAAAADDSIIEFGDSAATQKSFDVKIYGDAANGADYALFDAGASKVYTAGAYYIGGRTDDANGIGIAVGVRTTSSTASSTGTPTGSIYFNTSTSKLAVFDGAAWVSVALS